MAGIDVAIVTLIVTAAHLGHWALFARRVDRYRTTHSHRQTLDYADAIRPGLTIRAGPPTANPRPAHRRRRPLT